MASQELDKTLAALNHLSESDKRAIRRMTGALVNKILHDPTHFLKKKRVLTATSRYRLI